jgi:translocation and assembly module TamA
MWRGFLALVLVLCLAAAKQAAAEITYKTEFAGVAEDGQLARDLRNVSRLVELESRPAASELALTRRAEADRERLDTVLRSAGYYESTIAFDIDVDADPARVRVTIDPGPRYTLAAVKFVAPDGGVPPLIGSHAPADFGLAIGEPATARPILTAEQRITRLLAERGFPLARISNRRAVIDRTTRTMDVTYTVDAGPAAAFGPVAITGARDIDTDYIRRRMAWDEGAAFDVRLIERTRGDLIASGLFSTVRVETATAVGADGRVPVSIDVTERPSRSVGGGLSYDTSLGASGRIFWEHRNLFGNAERLRVLGEAGESRQGFTSTFRRPDTFDVSQDFVATALAENEDLEAYNRRHVLASAGIERRFSDRWTGGAALQAERTEVDEPDGTTIYTLFGLPLYLRRDGSNNLLDPTEGSRQSIAVTPYYGPELGFVSSRLQTSAYRALDDGNRYVVAGFAAIGSVGGEALDALPKDKRLYAGGGGSVRGYGFQKAGPLDSEGNPIGGRSSLELGIELRIKVTETIGVVPFFEAGNVYESTLPDLGEKLLYGTGLGLRYYTPIGPIRFDVGIPLDRRQEDDAFQIYISIGQAF